MEFQFHLWPHERYATIEDMAAVVQAGDRLGYTAAASGEHILVPNGPEAEVISYRYFDPMVMFSYLASSTTRIRLQFCALVVPYRHPALAARGIASLDQLSHGRIEVVVGSGWASGEFEALHVPFASRGAITDEYVDVMRLLWTEQSPAFDGHFVTFGPTTFEPKCVQQPHVPLWIGGGGKVAVRRMAAYGDGWAPMMESLDSARRHINEIREAVALAGRDPSVLGFTHGLTYLEADPYSDQASLEVAHADASARTIAHSSAEALEMIKSYADLGVTRVQVSFRWRSYAQYIERLYQFAEEVMSETANL